MEVDDLLRVIRQNSRNGVEYKLSSFWASDSRQDVRECGLESMKERRQWIADESWDVIRPRNDDRELKFGDVLRFAMMSVR